MTEIIRTRNILVISETEILFNKTKIIITNNFDNSFNVILSKNVAQVRRTLGKRIIHLALVAIDSINDGYRIIQFLNKHHKIPVMVVSKSAFNQYAEDDTMLQIAIELGASSAVCDENLEAKLISTLVQ